MRLRSWDPKEGKMAASRGGGVGKAEKPAYQVWRPGVEGRETWVRNNECQDLSPLSSHSLPRVNPLILFQLPSSAQILPLLARWIKLYSTSHKSNKAQKFFATDTNSRALLDKLESGERDRQPDGHTHQQTAGFSLDPGRDQSKTEEGKQRQVEKDTRTFMFWQRDKSQGYICQRLFINKTLRIQEDKTQP